MSIAAYPIQSSIPSYADFEPSGGENNGTAFVLRGQASGAPTILRPRETLIQEASMGVSVSATVNTQNNNASNNGYEGIAPTLELYRAKGSNLQKLWSNQLFEKYRPDLWIAEKRNWHTLTWIQEVPQLGADLLNFGLVNKCPSGYAKVSNISLTNHYSRYYDTVITGSTDSMALYRIEGVVPLFIHGEQYISTQSLIRYESYLDTIPVNIRSGQSVTQAGVGIIGCISNSFTDVPIELGITIKYKSRRGKELYKELLSIKSESPIIDNRDFMTSQRWVADQDYIMAEPILTLRTRYGQIHAVIASHRGIKVDISVTQSLLSSA